MSTVGSKLAVAAESGSSTSNFSGPAVSGAGTQDDGLNGMVLQKGDWNSTAILG